MLIGLTLVSGTDSPPPLQMSEAQATALGELLRIAPVIDELGERFTAAGEQIALVGGPVRDAFLGRLQNDLDFTTSARPEVTEKLLSGWADATWDVGRDFGTIGARRGEWTIEITTYRSESYDPDSRKPEVAYGDSIEGDLGRRDFTVNAMALTLPDRILVDPHGGILDLTHRQLRTPGRPEDSFSDDPLRMMRAARFAAQLGFSVAPEVVQAMTDMAERITIVSAERVRDELVKLMMAPRPAPRVDAVGRHRIGRPRAAGAASLEAGTRRAPSSQGCLRTQPDCLGAGH